VWWLDPPLSNLPAFIHLSVSPPVTVGTDVLCAASSSF